MRHWLRCRIALGQFDTEFAASGQQVNGKGFSLFVPINQVKYEQAPPPRGHSVGWLPVEVWDQQGDQVLVRLPQETLEDGYFVTVKADQVRSDSPDEAKAS
jgi:hypothetical protein